MIAAAQCEDAAGDDGPTLSEPDWPPDHAQPAAGASARVAASHAGGHAGAQPGRPATVSDEQLAAWLLAVAARDERALASVYDATFSRVYGLIRYIVRDAAMAEEVTEDTYFQVWRQALRFDPARGRALTWLLAIARSRAIDALRLEGRFSHECVDPDIVSAFASDAPAADELLDIARHHAELHAALMRLGAQPRQLVSLAFLRGLSHEEIADQMALPLGTVKSQIRRALHSLRDILGERGVLGGAS